MKYLKLFENFNEPDIQDAKWIVISHLGELENVEIDPKWNAKNLLSFELNEEPTKEQIEKCREHLNDEGFFLDDPGFINTNNDICIVGTGNSLKEYCINWLNDNFSDMDVVQSKDKPGYILYRYVDKNNILVYDKKNEYVYINYNKIWSFFENYFSMESEEIQELTQEWLSEAYNLKGVTTFFRNSLWFNMLSETYKII
jgi:hypothetical protein